MSEQNSAEMVAPQSLSGADFPLESFKDAARDLRRPFTSNAVKFKPGPGGLVFTYIDVRLVIERFNLVIPHLWHDDYEPIGGGAGMLCRLTVDGITRIDVGSGYKGKGLYSDALKRAAVKFGIGACLYAIPAIKTTGAHTERNGLTDEGVTHCRATYAEWLAEHGEQAFGEPLDHGDLEGAVGDAEAGNANAVEASLAEAPPSEAKLETAAGKSLIATAENLFKALDPKPYPPAQFQRNLQGVWHDQEQLEAFINTLEAAAK